MSNPQKVSNIGVREFGESIGVFDRATRKSQMLNPTASFVWQKCDGDTSPNELVTLLKEQFNIPQIQANQLLWLTLNELATKKLLVSETVAPAPVTIACDRREVLKGLMAVGLAAALLPTVAALPAKAAPLYPSQVVVTGHNGAIYEPPGDPADVNGTYLFDGIVNGRPSYRRAGNGYIFWNSAAGRWELTQSGSSPSYTIAQDTYLPPHTGWYDQRWDSAPDLDFLVSYSMPVGGVAQTIMPTTSSMAQTASRVAAFAGGLSAVAGGMWLMKKREQAE